MSKAFTCGHASSLNWRDAAAQGLQQAGKGPPGGLYYSCVGRGPNLFSDESGEANMIREALGEFPLAGFFCNGSESPRFQIRFKLLASRSIMR